MDSLPIIFLQQIFNPDSLRGALAWSVVFMAAAALTAAAIRRFTRRLEHDLSDVTGLRFSGALAQVVVYIIAFILYAHLIPKLHQIGRTLLAGVGVLSVIIGLAAQSTLGNLIAGFALVLYRPFRIGDRIQFTAPGGPTTATVKAISLGYTVLSETDHDEIVVPNSVMNSSVIVRLAANRQGAASADRSGPDR